MFAIGPLELICLGVFFVLCLGVAGLFVVTLLKRQPAAAPRPVDVGKSPPADNKQTATPSQASYLTNSDVSAAMVARLAQRFCPSCRAPLDRDAPEGLCPACLMAGGIASEFGEAPADGFAATTPPGERSESADHDVTELQAKFPQLEILELLGRGGMGSVYKVRQRNLDRIVALKVIPPASARDPEFAERFAREARALARLNHPNIVTVYDFGQANDVYYLLMEFVDGVNLRHTLRAGRLEPQEALAVVPQICDALQYAHDQGVVHRDIKPENVLLDRSGRIKIADFGLAKLLGLGADDFSLTRTQQVMGTPRYMAPEQIDRPSSVDHRADIYSLGVMIYEMLTGELPVGRFALPSEKASVDHRIDQVVLRSLEREPDLRYQRASQVKSELTAASAGMSPTPGFDSAEAWSGPRFPTPAAVYVEPKPPTYDSTAAAPPLAYLLLLAAGMVAGCLMLTIGFAMAVLAFTWQPMQPGVFGGWLGSAFGFICGGGGTLIGSYNSYRQLAGAEDLLRSPRTTWFDWLMRGYLVLGILLFGSAFIDFADGNPAIVTFPAFLIIGSIMLVQGALFALIRSLLPERHASKHDGRTVDSNLSPSLWRAAGMPAAAMTAIWLLIVVDVLYATPIIAWDDRGPQWFSYLFYQRWQVANWALGIGLIPLCFGVLASCRALGQRLSSGQLQKVLYPFEHPGWLLAAALLGLSTAVLPWAKLEHASDHTISVRIRDATGIDMSAIAGLPNKFRYTSRDVIAEPLGFAIFFSILLAVFALLPIPAKVRRLTTLGIGLGMLALAVTLLHAMADRPSTFILDQRTLLGIDRFLQKLGGGYVDPSEWARPLTEVITVRPAIGFFVLLGSAILAIFLGVSGLSWHSGEESVVAPAGEVHPPQKPQLQAVATVHSPMNRQRQQALQLVRGPAAGLFITGVLGLLMTVGVLLLAFVITPSATVIRTSSNTSPRRLAAMVVAGSDSAGVISSAGLALYQTTRHPFRFAQQMSSDDRARYTAQEAHASWMAIAMPTLLVVLLSMPISILLIVGSLRMWKLESYHFSLGVAVLACVPCTPAWLLGLPMGLWAVSVLLRPDVKAAFDQPTE